MTPGAPRADAQISYSASSPDDSAVVQGAARVGFTFLDRRAGRARTRLRGVVTDFRCFDEGVPSFSLRALGYTENPG